MARIAALSLLVAVAATGCTSSIFSSVRRPDFAYRALSKTRTSVLPPPGLLYQDVHAPVVPAIGPVGTKKGTSTSHMIGLPPIPYPGLSLGLDLLAWGDASVEAARRNGGIDEVGYVDCRMQNFLFLYRTFTIEVYGD